MTTTIRKSIQYIEISHRNGNRAQGNLDSYFIYIALILNSEENTNVVHERIICNKCDHPIIGTRFNCTTCKEFDLCETCESSKTHPETHLFLKIRFALPSQRLYPKISLNLYGDQTTSNRSILTTSGSQIRKPKILAKSEKGASLKVIIREMMPKDLDPIYDIEKESFQTPYPLDFFQQFPYSENCFLLVAEKPDSCIGGYIAYQIIKHKIQIVSIAVANHSRRMGIAQQLMEKVMCFAQEWTINEVYLHVSVMNFPAQNLYKSFGFTISKWINNYYKEENEHALFMVNNNPSNFRNNIQSKTVDSTILVTQSSMKQQDLPKEEEKKKETDDCVFL